MVERPSGTVTFLFTDIEGSTRRWETDPEAMRTALATHDDVLRTAVENHGGWLFKHTGDGVCAAFSAAGNAVDAAIDAQRLLGLPVRMGIATGEAEQRSDDYFGPALNRAARVMGVGHGGQTLVANSTAALLDGIELLDLGERRLRDLSGAEQLFQVQAEGLALEFPPLRTLDEVPGNLPVEATSFVGRDVEVNKVSELVQAHRLVTLTGVGGVGKTRLAVHVAGELAGEFPDGVWLVELAPVGDRAAVADVVATALRVIPRAGLSVTDSVAEALRGRRLLVVLDNCEHVLDAAADLVETVLARAETVKVIATSREGLRVDAEHLWPVPSLEVRSGVTSPAVELFVERAQAVDPEFILEDEPDVTAVTEICQRLDGIALAIELAAARMVSMTPTDVRDRLGDRFRLLSGSRRSSERHQTLRNAVGWSYDLLEVDERALLDRCSVFADGFGLAAATQICGEELDEYAVLDMLDSLVRKSLVTTESALGHARYGLLETIRQFAEDQLADSGTAHGVRARHAAYFATQAQGHWETWEGPGYGAAVDWVEVEFANLRTGFRWAFDTADLVTATAIAAHTTTLGFALQLFEPMSWAEEILPAATTAGVAQLPRLYGAAGLCCYVGRLETAVQYVDAVTELESDPRYDPFDHGWNGWWSAIAHVIATGDLDSWLDAQTRLAKQPGLAHLAGLIGLLYMLPVVGRAEEAMDIAEETLAVAQAHGNPFWTAQAQVGTGRAFALADPARALTAFRHATQDHRIPWYDARIAQESAGLEAQHGDLGQALDLFDTAIDSYHQAGNQVDLAATFTTVAVFFDRIDRPETAATIYGISTAHSDTTWVADLATATNHLRAALGDTQFDQAVASGAAMDPADAVQYANKVIQHIRQESR